MRRVGPYELLDVLGQGGMGTVYRARHVTSMIRSRILARLAWKFRYR